MIRAEKPSAILDFIDLSILSLIYSESLYWIYHSHSLNIEVNAQGVHRVEIPDQKKEG